MVRMGKQRHGRFLSRKPPENPTRDDGDRACRCETECHRIEILDAFSAALARGCQPKCFGWFKRVSRGGCLLFPAIMLTIGEDVTGYGRSIEDEPGAREAPGPKAPSSSWVRGPR